tara:strand:- start:523 stop:1332 length:810 start_codon:yes stop_codon:yes gene_type:complete
VKKYLVIGNPIDHSLSPKIHNYWFEKYKIKNSIYEKKKIEQKDLSTIYEKIKKGELEGVNVTLPFKKSILPILDILEISAIKTQSVNTIFRENGKVIGTNTDWGGFNQSIEKTLLPTQKNLDNKSIFILGAGGVASSIIYALKKLGGKIFVSNRTQKKAEELKNLFPEINIIKWGNKPPKCEIVVNTTSVGLNPADKIDLDFSDYNNNELFFDLIYNPKETNFLKEAKLRGNKTINGKMMFLYQAAFAFSYWTRIKPEIDDEVIEFLDQ